MPDGELTRIAEDLVAHNAALLGAGEELALVMFATPGPIGYFAGQLRDNTPTLGMHTAPLPFSRYARFFREGAHIVVSKVRQIPAQAVDPRVKHRSRLHWWQAEREAQQRERGAVALLLDHEEHVTETALASLLVIRGGAVLSPPRTAVLNGISLQTVEELCGELGIPFAEQPLTLADCVSADETALCGTAFCLAGVSKLDSMPLPFPGPITERLLAAWSRRVGLDIRAQFLAHG
jgi:branched-subunit amino acid aminotransferase/4-amino-4-deoxychorismate lyase